MGQSFLRLNERNNPGTKVMLVLFFFFFMVTQCVMGQQMEIKGKVSEARAIPLPGANILEKGTVNGVTADFDGNFSMKVTDGNSVLEISYIGFATKIVNIEGESYLDIEVI